MDLYRSKKSELMKETLAKKRGKIHFLIIQTFKVEMTQVLPKSPPGPPKK